MVIIVIAILAATGLIVWGVIAYFREEAKTLSVTIYRKPWRRSPYHSPGKTCQYDMEGRLLCQDHAP